MNHFLVACGKRGGGRGKERKRERKVGQGKKDRLRTRGERCVAKQGRRGRTDRAAGQGITQAGKYDRYT